MGAKRSFVWLISLLVLACSPEPGRDAPVVATGRVIVAMHDDMRFSPANLSISVGDTVVWVNEGELPHTSSDKPGRAAVSIHNMLPESALPWDSGLLKHGDSVVVVFETPGEYTYLCLIHETNGMVGKIGVTE